jgi:hypothetical protein
MSSNQLFHYIKMGVVVLNGKLMYFGTGEKWLVAAFNSPFYALLLSWISLEVRPV